jgi:hypothetical protein
MDYHKIIIRHVKQNGEHTTVHVAFTLHNVYDELLAFAVAPIPSALVGEIAKLECTPDYAYGVNIILAWGIEPNSDLVFEIEMLN